MNQLLSIVDDKIVIEKLRVKFTEGPLTHAGSLNVVGDTTLDSGLTVAQNAKVNGSLTANTINVDTIKAKHIECDERGGINDPFAFVANTELELDGKGFLYTDGLATRQFVYKQGNKMFSSMNIDLARDRHYSIDGVPVIRATALGDNIVNSNLQSVGELNSLKVTGAVEIAEFAFFNPNHNRLGVNTDNPNAALGVFENNVDLVIGSYKNDVGYIGTYNNSGLEIGTDNTARVTIRNTGEIEFGHSKYNNAVVKIHGKLEVDELVAKNEQSQPLTFSATNDRTVYGTGIIWYQNKTNRQLTYAANPDRIWSSEIIDLAAERYYSVDGAMVLSKHSLGETVTSSHLTKLGTLTALENTGEAKLHGLVKLGANNELTLSKDGIKFNDENELNITSSGVRTKNSFSINCDSEQEFKIDSNGSIEIGNRQNTNRRVAVYGQLSVGVSNPDTDVAFTVGGAVNLNNKKFVKDSQIPSSGRFNVGDICWNTAPEATAYVGWICIKEGTPGEWLPFGQIASQ